MILIGFLIFLSKMALTVAGLIISYPQADHIEKNFEEVVNLTFIWLILGYFGFSEQIYHVYSPVALLVTSIPQIVFDLLCTFILGELNALHVFLTLKKMTTYELILERRRKKAQKKKNYEEAQASTLMGSSSKIRSSQDLSPNVKNTRGFLIETMCEVDDRKHTQNPQGEKERKTSHEEGSLSSKKVSLSPISDWQSPKFKMATDSDNGEVFNCPEKPVSFRGGKKFDEDSVEEIEDEDFHEENIAAINQKKDDEKIDTRDIDCGIESNEKIYFQESFCIGGNRKELEGLRKEEKTPKEKENTNQGSKKTEDGKRTGLASIMESRSNNQGDKSSMSHISEGQGLCKEDQTRSEKRKRLDLDKANGAFLEGDSRGDSNSAEKSQKLTFRDKLSGMIENFLDKSINFGMNGNDLESMANNEDKELFIQNSANLDGANDEELQRGIMGNFQSARAPRTFSRLDPQNNTYR